jgi:small neutral amino acid transporter SnatA (MarC family)
VLFYCFGQLIINIWQLKIIQLPVAGCIFHATPNCIMAHMNEEQLGHISVPRPDDLVEKPSVVKWSPFLRRSAGVSHEETGPFLLIG